MVGQPFIFLMVYFKNFPVIGLLYTGNNIRTVTIFQVSAMNAEEVFVMPDILGINRVEIAFAKRQVMDGIQQVCFSSPVITDKTIDLVR